MSMMTRIGVRSLPLSIIETALFFVLTAGYFATPPRIYSKVQEARSDARAEARTEFMEPAIAKAVEEGKTPLDAKKLAEIEADREIGLSIRRDASTPIWVWVILGLVYLLIVTVWWTPGSEEDNKTELTALAIVFILTLVLAGVYKHEVVIDVVGEFWNILVTGGGRTG